MKNIENEYNKRFKNHEMDNSDFDVDGLWDAITEDLDAPTMPPGAPPKDNPFFKYFGFGLLMLLIIGVGFLYLSQTDSSQRLATKNTNTQDQSSQQNINNQRVTTSPKLKTLDTNSSSQKKHTNQSNHNNNIKSNTNASIDISQKSKSIDKTQTNSLAEKYNPTKSKTDFSRKSKTPNSSNIEPQDVNQNMTNSGANRMDPNSKSKKNIKENTVPLTEHNPTNPNPTSALQENNPNMSIAPNQNNTEPTPLNLAAHNIETIDTNNLIVAHSNTSNPTPKDSPTSNTKELKISSIQTSQPKDPKYTSDQSIRNHSDVPPTESDTAFVNNLGNQLDSLAANKDPILPIKPTNPRNIHWEVSLFGGTNKTFLNFNPNNDLSELRNTNEKGTWGTSYGVTSSMIWKNKGIISTGLEYHTLWSKLDYTQEKTRTQDSVLQEVLITPNGQIIAMTYDSITKLLKHQTIWNNQYKTYRIPLEIGYQKYFNKWTLGAKVGAIFNITTSQKGKTFSDEKIISNFTQADSFSPLTSFQVGFRVSPYIGYQITNKISMQLQPKWNWYKGQTADIQEFGLNIGIGLRF